MMAATGPAGAATTMSSIGTANSSNNGGDHHDSDDDDDDGNDADEVRMMAHNQRFQAAVLRTMDTQLNRLESQLRDKDAVVSSSEHAREDMALSLRDLRKQVDDLNQSLVTSRTQVRDGDAQRRLLQADTKRLASANEQLTIARDDAVNDANDTRKQLQRVTDELHQSRTLHTVFASDLKMHRSLHDHTTSQLTKLTDRAEAADAKAKEWQAKHDKVLNGDMISLRQSLEAQQSETIRTVAQLDKVVNEMQLLRTARDVLAKQWEDALTAMRKRDETTMILNQQRDAAVEENKALKMSERRLLLDNAELKRNNELVGQRQDAHETRMRDMGLGMKEADSQHRAVVDEAESLRSQLSATTADVTLTRRERDNAFAEITEKDKRIMSLRADVQTLNAKYLSELEARVTLENQSSLHTSHMQKKYDADMKTVETRATNMDNERAHDKYRLLQLEREHAQLSVSNTSLRSDLQTMSDKYEQVFAQVRSLEDELERMTYKANRATYDSDQLKAAQTAAAQATHRQGIAELKATERALDERKKELSTLNAAYMSAHEKMLKTQHEQRSRDQHMAGMESQLSVAEAIRTRLKNTNDKLERDHIERLKELDTNRLELRHRDEEVSVLRLEKDALLRKLADAEALFKARTEEHRVELLALRTELNRARNDKTGLPVLVENAHREANVAERKLQMLTAKHEKQYRELQETQRAAFELKMQLKNMNKMDRQSDRDLAEASKQFETRFARELKERASSGAPRSLRHMLSMSAPNIDEKKGAQTARLVRDLPLPAVVHASSATPVATGRRGGGSNSVDSSFTDTLVHELRKQLNRASTVAAERMNEMVRLKEELTAIRQSSSIDNHQHAGMMDQSRALAAQVSRLETSLLNAQNSRYRAEALAASFERQLSRVLLVVRHSHHGGINTASSSSSLATSLGSTVSLSSAAASDRGHDDRSAAISIGQSIAHVPTTIDYSYFADLEPSPPLRAAIDGHTPSRTTVNTTNTNNNAMLAIPRPMLPAAPPALPTTSGNGEYDSVSKSHGNGSHGHGSHGPANRRRRLRAHQSSNSSLSSSSNTTSSSHSGGHGRHSLSSSSISSSTRALADHHNLAD